MQTASSAPRKGALTRALSAPGTANGLILLGAVLQVLFFILYLINGDVHVDEAMQFGAGGHRHFRPAYAGVF